MNKIAIVLVALMALVGVASAQTVSTANFANPLPVADAAFSQAGTTQVLTASTTIQAMPVFAGYKAVAVTTYNGDMAYGNASLTNTVPCYFPKLGSGTTVIWNLDSIKPKANGIYFLNYAVGGAGAVSFTPLK
jgi:hypothetical protein